jgi:hypothetical protein
MKRHQPQFEPERDQESDRIIDNLASFLFWCFIWAIIFGGSLIAIGWIASSGYEHNW